MSAQPAYTHYTEEEYLELEESARYRSEYYQGEIFAMAGASPVHNRVKENLSVDIGFFLKRKPCHTYSSDQRVHIKGNGLYTYPDLVIVCGKDEFAPKDRNALINPSVLIEITSKATADYDKGIKFHLYRKIPTLKEYILIDSLRLYAVLYRKTDEGLWVLASEATEITESIIIETIEYTLNMADVYANTEFEAK
jgi:Uma2 family endonuclease